jgi:hypothetical protein
LKEAKTLYWTRYFHDYSITLLEFHEEYYVELRFGGRSIQYDLDEWKKMVAFIEKQEQHEVE